MTGEVVYFFAFDVANELVVESARRLLAARGYAPAAGGPPAPRGLALHPPLAVAFPVVDTTVHGSPLVVELRLFEFGAVSVVMRVGVEVDVLAGLAKFLSPTLGDGRRPDDLARTLCEQVCREVGPALVRPSEIREPEPYSVAHIRDLGGAADVEHWLADHRTEVAGLLTGLPPDRIGTGQVEEVFRHYRSLTKSDAVVLAWDAGLVVDLAGPAADLLYTIELANLQLEEFRHMDRSLDRFLNQAYADLERRTPFGTSVVLRKLRWFRVDLARLADEVTNTTKVFGDWHLARVYVAARERFHLDRWRESVEYRLGQLDQLYNLVRSELWDRRMFVLELVVVILIVVEIVTSLGLGH